MDLRYFYVPKKDIKNDRVYIFGQEYLHLHKVLRKRQGDIIKVVNGEGDEYTVLLSKTEDGYAEGKIIEKRRKPNEIPFELAFACGVLKGERMDLLIEKGTELGVTRFFPLLTEKTEVEPSESKVLRWNKIAISAMKQSRRSVLPFIERPVSLSDFGNLVTDYDLKILLNEKVKIRPEVKENNFRRVVIVAGPEGSFTQDEINFLKKIGFEEWNLGLRTLRSETALLFAGMIFLYLSERRNL
ncbi:MAG: RsmE family RNA methyltransferase [Candidatus Hydrothermales bacterium]